MYTSGPEPLMLIIKARFHHHWSWQPQHAAHLNPACVRATHVWLLYVIPVLDICVETEHLSSVYQLPDSYIVTEAAVIVRCR
jgi:hypothetical protein